MHNIPYKQNSEIISEYGSLRAHSAGVLAAILIINPLMKNDARKVSNSILDGTGCQTKYRVLDLDINYRSLTIEIYLKDEHPCIYFRYKWHQRSLLF